MKKQLALLAVLGLFLIAIVNPCPYSMPPAIGNEITDEMINRFGETLPDNTLHYPDHIPAADGDESSESITSFSETLADDVLFYPDALPSDASASAGAYTETQGGTYASTSSKDDSFWTVYDYTAPHTVYLNLTFTLPTGGILESGKLSTYILARDKDVNFITYDILFYDWTNSEWDVIDSEVGGAASYRYNTVYSQDYLGGDSFKCSVTPHDPAEDEPIIYWDWALVDFEIMTLADSDHYAESFADVSDWTEVASAIAPTTDGDLMTLEVPDDNTYYYWYTNEPSFSNVLEYYFEVTYKSNHSVGSFIWICVGYTADDRGGTSFYIVVANQFFETYSKTSKYCIDDNYALESLAIICKQTSGSGGIEGYFDYLRIAPADEMGWQHDGSTTAATENDADADVTYTTSSDSDILTMKIERTGAGAAWSTTQINIDSTSTSCDIESDYYPFVEVRVRLTWRGSVSMVFEADARRYLFTSPQNNTWHTYRANFKAQATSGEDDKRLRFSAYLVAVGEYFQAEVDWVQAYSIANFTVTQYATVTTSDYAYVESNQLKLSRITADFILFNHDPALSVNTATYNVWALDHTATGASHSLQFYVGGWGSVQYWEERGALASGTLTDFYFYNYLTDTVTSLKFIEDGTAPDILDKFVTPIIPDDDESVTITAVTYDAIEVYEVTINAVVYPAGFSDVDYDLTEQTEGVLWSYEFSILTAGYYLFQVTASDGGNTYSEYIPVTVRVSIIEITTYTFFGAGSDFSYMQYSGYINRDCTYNISEWSDSWAKNETHTGSVTEGMFNIAWDKIGVDDLNANFTIVFLNGSLSLTIEGYYGTAYKLLRITEIEFENIEESQAVTNITVNFYTNKDIDWFVYDRDDSDAVLASGSSSEGSDYLVWLKDTTPHAHKYAIKWTDGVSDIWVNGSYWTYRENLDSLDQPGADWEARDTRRTIEFWTTLGAFVAVAGIIAIGIVYYKLNKKIGNLPNYQTQ